MIHHTHTWWGEKEELLMGKIIPTESAIYNLIQLCPDSYYYLYK